MRGFFNPLKIAVLILLLFSVQLFKVQAVEKVEFKTSTGSSMEYNKTNKTQTYKVKSYLKEYDSLDKELKNLLLIKLSEWDLQAPLDDTFIIESGRFEKTWGIIFFRAKDKYDTGELKLSENEEVHYGVQKQLIYSKDSKGKYIAAFKEDSNLITVLDSISNSELSMEAKITAWDYPASKSAKQSMAAASPLVKFPWQATTPYNISQTWHYDGFNRWSIDFKPKNNTEFTRKIVSPVSGTISNICKGILQTYIFIKRSGTTEEYGLLHLSTPTISTKLVLNGNISQGDEIGYLYNDTIPQTNSCVQKLTGTHLHMHTNSVSKNMVIDGYTITTNSDGSFKLLGRNSNQISDIWNHDLISTQLRDIYTPATNCQNGRSGSYCLDRPNAHIIKGRIMTGINSAGKPILRVEVSKVDGGKFTTSGKMKIYDQNRGYISKLDSSDNATANKSEISFSSGRDSIVFYIDPSYLNLNETTNLSIRLLSSNGSTMYIDYFKITKARG